MSKEGFLVPNTGRIAELIRDQGLKNYWVAEQAGLHKATLYRWFSGETALVREQNLTRIAAVLLTEVSDLVTTDATAKTRAAQL